MSHPIEKTTPELTSSDDAIFALSLEGFEGPLDLLLNLVREKSFDLSVVSVAALAEQYSAFLHRIAPQQLQCAAEYLVMAAWLARLKSRLLLPEDDTSDEENPYDLAERLAWQMRRLAAMQSAAEALRQRPQLGREIFGRGSTTTLEHRENITYSNDLTALLRAFRHIEQRQTHRKTRLKLSDLPVLSIDAARRILKRLIAGSPQWHNFAVLVSDNEYSTMSLSSSDSPLYNKSCRASTFMAALELQQEGQIEIRQQDIHHPAQIREVLR